jgi:hypothetical protein
VKLRVGRHVGRTLYLQRGEQPSRDDALIGVMDTRELAAIVVTAVNRLGDVPTSPGDRPAGNDLKLADWYEMHDHGYGEGQHAHSTEQHHSGDVNNPRANDHTGVPTMPWDEWKARVRDGTWTRTSTEVTDGR